MLQSSRCCPLKAIESSIIAASALSNAPAPSGGMGELANTLTNIMESINRLADSINTPVNDSSNYGSVWSNEGRNTVSISNIGNL